MVKKLRDSAGPSLIKQELIYKDSLKLARTVCEIDLF
jgi:hypothetical protein